MIDKSERKIAARAKQDALKSLGVRLREARINAGLTQGDAADQIQVSTQTIRNWEAGRNEPDMYSIESLASVYDVGFHQIAEPADDPMVNPSVLLPYNRIEVDLARLLIARQDAQLTQAQAAELASISANSIGRYESGLSKPTLATLKTLAIAYEKPLPWFINYRGPQGVNSAIQSSEHRQQRPAQDLALAAYDAVRADLPEEEVALIADFIHLVHERLHKSPSEPAPEDP